MNILTDDPDDNLDETPLVDEADIVIVTAESEPRIDPPQERLKMLGR